MTDTVPTLPKRSCGTCSACCEGWLSGQAYGRPFWKGRPCYYLTEGKCSIYGNHPQDPCKSFRCQWLADENIPGWMKPNEIKAIIVQRRRDGIDYIECVEAGEKLRVEVLSWLVMYALRAKVNLRYFVNGGANVVGSPEFVNMQW